MPHRFVHRLFGGKRGGIPKGGIPKPIAISAFFGGVYLSNKRRSEGLLKVGQVDQVVAHLDRCGLLYPGDHSVDRKSVV